MAEGVSYKPMIWSALVFAILIISIGIYPLFDDTFADKKELYKVIRKIGNLLLYLLAKVLSGPFLGLSVTTILCDSNNVYHTGSVCYSTEHILYCSLAALLILMVIYSILGISFVFYSRNPFEGSCLGHPNRNYMITKSIFKILFPIFFALNGSLNLDFLYIFASPTLWGAYIVFHRLNSYHTFNHKHFYF